MIKEMIGKIVEGVDLSFEESKAVMEEIMEGKATEAQIASFITALRMKGETVDEIAMLDASITESDDEAIEQNALCDQQQQVSQQCSKRMRIEELPIL